MTVEVLALAHITCRVCGEELTGVGTPPVSCLSCDTPYHIDCWSYNGSRCGVYGCSGHRAVAGLRTNPELLLPRVVAPRQDSGQHSYSLQPTACSLSAGEARAVRLLPPIPPARFVWRRSSVELGLLALGLVALPAAGCVSSALGSSLFHLPLALVCLLWWATDRFLWLSAVEVDDAGLCFRYWLHPPKRVSWGEVVRGPGAGDWTGALELADGTIVVMPRGAPGFDEVLRRTAVALASLQVSADLFYIGEEA